MQQLSSRRFTCGQTWDFTQRAKVCNTFTAGARRIGYGVAPLVCDLDEIQDFEETSGCILREQPMDDWTEQPATRSEKNKAQCWLDSLAEYVSSLISLPSPHLEHTSGAQHFIDEGCVDCHIPPLYTDSNLLSPIRMMLEPSRKPQVAGKEQSWMDDTPTLLLGTRHHIYDGSAKASLKQYCPRSISSLKKTLISIAQYMKSL